MSDTMFDTIRKRRSIRRYEEKDVSDEMVEKILQAGFFSPSASNRRPWHFVVVRDKETIQKLSKARDGSSGFAGDASVIIVVCADSEIAGRWIADCSIASITMQYMITELGLGSCWIHINDSPHGEDKTAEEYVREVLNIPTTIRVLNLLSIGYPAVEKSPHDDEEFMADRVHRDTF